MEVLALSGLRFEFEDDFERVSCARVCVRHGSGGGRVTESLVGCAVGQVDDEERQRRLMRGATRRAILVCKHWVKGMCKKGYVGVCWRLAESGRRRVRAAFMTGGCCCAPARSARTCTGMTRLAWRSASTLWQQACATSLTASSVT